MMEPFLASKDYIGKLQQWIPNDFNFGTWEHCFYCGEMPNSRDHVVPRSMMSQMSNHDGQSPGPKTKACMVCNRILSDLFFDTLSERCQFVKSRICQKARKPLRTADWTEKEIAGLDRKLRSFVSSKVAEKKEWERKVAWQDGAAFAKMHSEAHAMAKAQFPGNFQFQNFMRPSWE